VRKIALSFAAFLITLCAASAQPIRLAVDLREAPQRVLHARETIPVTSGPLALRYAKWLPGEHSPTGPVVDMAGLRITAGKQALAWQRDAVDMYLFRVTVPAGVTRIEIALDYLAPSSGDGFTNAPSTSAKLAMLAWNAVLLYPDGVRPAALQFEPQVELPSGWEAATALRIAEQRGHRIAYAPVSLETLVDSPLLAGAHYRPIPLAAPAGAPEHVLHVMADSEAALAAKPETLAAFARLVPEAHALFGAHHYRRYDFLLALSDHVSHFGLEHHESSDNRLPERTFLDEASTLSAAWLLPHEFVHSWNGKYRRPAGLATRDFTTPMDADLLWVYEGLTSYWAEVLTARAGLVTPEQERDSLAWMAASLANRKGREWRPLADTAREVQHLFGARWEGTSWRRGVDFYDEGALVWLEVDALIRAQTGGAKSLDDLAHAFFSGAESGGPEVKPYARAELVAALNALAARDWEAFFAERIDRLRPGAPLEGIEAAGWKLAYTEAPNALGEAYAAESEGALNVLSSLGAYLTGEAKVGDVVPDSPFDRAGIGVGAEVVAVNSRAFTPDVLADAMAAAKDTGAAIELLVKNADFFTTHEVDYRGGARHPHLVRDETKADLLSAILAPKTWNAEQRPAEATPERSGR
jgi:predicted metalloprotease with PDZ domain